MSSVYVVSISYIAQIKEQILLDVLVNLGYVTKIAVWWNKISLLEAIDQFRLGQISPKIFKETCDSLFPELAQVTDDDFFKAWGQACHLHTNIQARLNELETLLSEGNDIRIVGNMDVIQFNSICEQLKDYDQKLLHDDLSFFVHQPSHCIVSTIVNQHSKGEPIYYVPPTISPKPYSGLGILGWVVAPFQRWFHRRETQESRSILEVTKDAENFVILEMPSEGDIALTNRPQRQDSASPDLTLQLSSAFLPQFGDTSRFPFHARSSHTSYFNGSSSSPRPTLK